MSSLGIIHPPKDIKSIVDTTAQAVSKHGNNFEDIIRVRNLGNNRFGFLNKNNPYHNYYLYKLEQFSKGEAPSKTNKQEETIKPLRKISEILKDEVQEEEQNKEEQNEEQENKQEQEQEQEKEKEQEKDQEQQEQDQDQDKEQTNVIETEKEAIESTPDLKTKKNNEQNIQIETPQTNKQSTQKETTKIITQNTKTQKKDPQSLTSQLIANAIKKQISRTPKRSEFEILCDQYNGKKKTSKQTPTEPEPYLFLSEIPIHIPTLTIEVMKLTAQFTALNGQSFLNGLTSREFQNPQFDFLKLQNPLHTHFMSYVEQYKNCIIPNFEILNKIDKNSKDRMTILDTIKRRSKWLKYRESILNPKFEQELRESMELIDWSTFSIVATVEFEDKNLQENEPLNEIERDQNKSSTKHEVVDMELEEPMNNENKKPLEEQKEQQQGIEIKTETMETQLELEREPEIEKIELNINSKDYNKLAEQLIKSEDGKLYQISPFTGVPIPLEEFEQHIKVEYLNRKQREIDKQVLERNRNTNLTQSQDMANNLKRFVRQRKKISQMDVENENSLIKDQKNESEKKMVWDGYSGSIPLLQANIFKKLVEQEKNPQKENNVQPDLGPKPRIIPNTKLGIAVKELEKQLHLRKTNSLIPKQIQIQQPELQPPMPLMNFQNKKVKINPESKLIPEKEFIQKNGNTSSFLLSLPLKLQQGNNQQPQDFKFNQETIKMKFNVTRSIQELIDFLKKNHNINFADYQLKTSSGMSLLNNETLAFYNISNDDILMIVSKKSSLK
ncbi:splicing factor 3a subunit [Anaeramoeba flamelloides]|uniref:Splicing factor 3a subunit n=1 Tax=Anaeramoeba flamelloides TaxID=1746091 RepID=A0AAV7Y9F6_9EUKA|nr:splicing factor 3a subunit [Anaeramoeba flamelloides]